MPTYNRRPFVPLAIRWFLAQDYPNRELIVIDDGSDPVADLMPPSPRVQYHRLGRKLNLGAKRNLACELARGNIICHWDDDDWMAPWRLQYQVRELLHSQADLCGTDRLLFFDPGRQRAWRYVYPRGGRPWVAGATLCYFKAFWRQNPFPEIDVGEDTRFVWGKTGARIHTLDDHSFYVAIIHPGNTSPKRTADRRWVSRPVEEIFRILGDQRAFYETDQREFDKS